MCSTTFVSAGSLLKATQFLEQGTAESEELREAIIKTRKEWAAD